MEANYCGMCEESKVKNSGPCI